MCTHKKLHQVEVPTTTKKVWDAGIANDSRNEGRKIESEETEVTHHTPRKALPSWVSRFVPVFPHQSHGYNP